MELDQQIRPKKEGKKVLLAVALIVVVGIIGFFSNKFNGAGADKINFDLYVMSQCPYGSQAEGIVLGAMTGLGEYVNFNVDYIAEKNSDGSFQSLHGEPEVQGDKYQLCVKNYYPEKFWDYLACQNKNYQDLNSSFESCANEINAAFATIKACAEGSEGNELLEESLNKAKGLSVSASPTFYIAGELYDGPRAEIAIKRTLCEKIDNEAKACKDLPEDKEFTAYLINDSRCTKAECDTTGLESQLKATFSKIQFEKLDYNTEAGKQFYEDNTLLFLPAVLFTKEVEETDNYSQVEPYLQPVGDLYNLAIGSIHDPTKEICNNNIDDTGNGQVDCADDDCAGALECRQEITGRLDIFVMSQCPYGTTALNAMKDVLDNFGNNIKFNINYIAGENPDGTFASLHGQGEVDEDIRELCAIKYYPTNYMDYIWCRNQDITGAPDECLQNFSKINACATGAEGKKLLSENIKTANELGIGASPTWIVNNKYVFNGLDAETVRQNFCQYNDVAGCENVLGASTSNVSAGGSCN